jgi:hypothetical protein
MEAVGYFEPRHCPLCGGIAHRPAFAVDTLEGLAFRSLEPTLIESEDPHRLTKPQANEGTCCVRIAIGGSCPLSKSRWIPPC